MRKLKKTGPTREKPAPMLFQVDRATIERQTEAMGGLDGVMHAVVMSLSSMNGGRPPPEIQNWRAKIRDGAPVRVVMFVGDEAPIEARIS